MATLVLSAVGGAIGASIGGGILDLSSVVIGKAIGASLGQAVDSRILGEGSEAVETGKVDRLRLTGASEGATIPMVYGRARLGGQVIWATRFQEHVTTSGGGTSGGGGGGKGAPSAAASSDPEVTTYSYSISLAVALCEGEITRVGRIWADGNELAPGDYNIRVYKGTQTQTPDPKIEAVKGAGRAPAYRGVAYVVIEDLDLTPFGNRVPQFSFEVMRPEQPYQQQEVARGTNAVALIPGTGEYSLATTPVFYGDGLGSVSGSNMNSPSGKTDFATSYDMMREELPNCENTSLVVSWFGNDLRCAQCRVQPLVEKTDLDGLSMPWNVSGVDRATAGLVPTDDEDRPIYGGTPSDQAVKEAITRASASGRKATFYPFILMRQMEDNNLPDPWSGGAGQAVLPWRGRITTSLAPHHGNSPDGYAAAVAEVAAFFGSAQASDFAVTANGVDYTGSDGFTYRRFILHYAHLCASAGGVDAFLIGSELRSLTQVRGPNNSFPAVEQLIQLAADARAIFWPRSGSPNYWKRMSC